MSLPIPSTAIYRSRRILILYDHHWLHIKTISDYLVSFRRYSSFEVYYATCFGPCYFDLNSFDAIVIHYSVKVCYPGYLSSSYERALRKTRSLKILFLQDEYEATNANRKAINDLGISQVFSCVPPSFIDIVYPKQQFPNTRFDSILTGYVPLDVAQSVHPIPMSERTTMIAYRGRNIGYWYGNLAREKYLIGKQMRYFCDQYGIKSDIEWEEDKRIYGDDWLTFLSRARATLGTESGANVFDYDGSITLSIQRELLNNPTISYEDVHAKYLKHTDGSIIMNQISPRIFEAIACRTVLILFEGSYSGIISPYQHFIPLKKDFSNIAEIFRLLHDCDYLESLADRAFNHVIASNRYSYQTFIESFDQILLQHWRDRGQSITSAHNLTANWLPTPPCDTITFFRNSYIRTFQGPLLKRIWSSLPDRIKTALRPILNRERWKNRWILLPDHIRNLLLPLLSKIRWILKAS
jgi:hypothetical protein